MSDQASPSADDLRIHQIASHLDDIAALHARIAVVNDQVAIFDLRTVIAWLTASWVRARIVIEFLLNAKRSVNADHFLNGTHLSLDRRNRARLEEHRATITEFLVHFKMEPRRSAQSGYRLDMPHDLIQGLNEFITALDTGGAPNSDRWAKTLRRAVSRAEAVLAAPDRHFDILDLIDDDIVRVVRLPRA
jgi:hypothetical protein